MYRILIFILFFIIACSRGNVVNNSVQDKSLLASVKNFLSRSVNDCKSAGAVIEKHRIIQHLTHLKKMNNGGRKYYLLEKDHITEMINAVTKGVYDDYLLVNRNGILIYSRSSDDLFGTDIRYGFEDSPIYKLFSKGESGIRIHDISPLSSQRGGACLYVSIPVYVEGSYHGILILKADQSKIAGLSTKKFFIVDNSGIIRVSGNTNDIYKNYSLFGKIAGDSGSFADNSTKVQYSKLSYMDLNWNILEINN